MIQPLGSPASVPAEDQGAYVLHRGWLPLTVDLREQVDNLLGPDRDAFHWVQFKEKLGSARFHGVWTHEPRDAAVKEAVADVVNRAVLASAHTCIVCGAPAPVAAPNVPLCAVHEALRPGGRWEAAAAAADWPW